MFQKNKNSNIVGFTLIELLVVVAIIGILSGVVLASLNSARTKGQIASIKSNLKNMIAQAELSYDTPGNYSTVCTDPGIVKMLAAITSAGGAASCYSHSAGGYSRWGVSAKLNSDATKNYTVDQNGVATWDTTDAPLPKKTWSEANPYCISVGGRLPTLEQLKTIYLTYGMTPTSIGFIADAYWTNTTDPTDSSLAYGVYMSDGRVGSIGKTSPYVNVRCVR